jgi:hypothetical protein
VRLVCEFRFDGWCCSFGKHDGSIGRENGQMPAWLQMPTSVSPGKEVVSAMRLAWGIAKGALAALALAAAFCAAPPAPATAQEEEHPSADVPGRKIIRTQRLRVHPIYSSAMRSHSSARG